jgi:hypothetical protein
MYYDLSRSKLSKEVKLGYEEDEYAFEVSFGVKQRIQSSF